VDNANTVTASNANAALATSAANLASRNGGG
jgi:hypothetical protein